MSIDITNVKAELRTWGKFKTRFIGVHTPPVVRFELQQLKLYSVDEYGEPLQEKWPKVNGKIIVCKKMEFIMKLQVEKISGVNSGSERRTIMSETPCVFDLSITKNITTSSLLAVSLQVFFDNIEIMFDSNEALQYLLEAIFGMIFCFSKVSI